MNELEDDLKRVLRQRADGDYLTGPDAMLGRVHLGAKRLRRRRAAMTGTAVLALVAIGTGLALGGGNLMNTKPPVVAPSTTTSASPSAAPTIGASAPTQAVNPPVGGATTRSGTTTPPSTPVSTPPATPTPPPSSGITVTGFSARSLVPYGASTFRVLGDAQCNGSQCYPILVTNDGGRSFALEGVVPGQVFTIGGSGNHRWAYGFGVWDSFDGGKTWKRTTSERPAGSVARVDNGSGSPVLLANDGSSLWQGGGNPYWYRIAQGFDRIDDRSVRGRAVISGDSNGEISVTVSGSSHITRPTGCKTVSASWTTTRVASGPGDVIWLLCPGASGTATLRLSTDAGKTWRAVPAKLPYIGMINLLAARTATSAVLYTGPSNKVYLVTAGGSVRAVTLPGSGAPSPHYLHFQTEDVGYLVEGFDRVYRTTDGGRIWSRVRFTGFQ